MSLGNLLLQPQRLQRNSSAEPKLDVAEDLLRLITLLAEDAVDEGPLASVLPGLLSRFTDRVQAQAENGVEDVYSSLKTRFHPLFQYFNELIDEISELDENPEALLNIVSQIINNIRDILDGITQSQIESQLNFAKELIEQQLAVDPQFVNQQIALLFDDLIELWQQLPTDISAKRRRRQRLAVRIVKRLRRHLLNRFTLPEIETTAAARKLYQLYLSTDLQKIFDEIHCILDKFDEAVNSVNEIRTALPLNLAGASVGAAFIEPEGSARYCWYASWLLSDVDLALLGTGDIIKDKKREFAISIRFRNSVIKKQAAVSKYIFSTLTLEQQQQVMAYTGGSTEPDDSLILMLVAHINQLMQQGPIYTRSRFNNAHDNQSEQDLNALPFEFRLREDERFVLPESLQEMADEYVESQCLYLYNRRFIEWVYGAGTGDGDELICVYTNAFWRFVGLNTIGCRRDVFISGDGRYLMCDDKPIYTVAEGVELEWQAAPLFIDKDVSRTPVEGAIYYRFTRVSANACDIMAQIVYGLEQTGRPIWHLVDLQPEHEIGTGIISGLDILHALNQLFLGKPVSGYESLGGWGSWLANDLYGPRGLALFGGSFQGLHTEATAGNGFWFWLTVVLGDFIRISGHNGILQSIRNFILTFFTLLNSSPSNSGDSSLPRNPAANHLKQEGIISPMNTLFAYLLLLNYDRENHSIEIWSADDIGDRREQAFGLWLGGGLGFGVLSGLSGSIVSQFIAWQEDWKLLGKTIAGSIAYMILGYWFFEYFFKEGDTADGTLAENGTYKGYPAKANSPYRLPYANGTALYMGQGNNGLFSHNEITNLGGNWQIYAFDLGHDHREMIRAMRSGVVWSFDEGFDDNNDEDANFIIIRHDTLIDDHDDPFGTGTPLVTFARYWHGAQNGVTNAFGGTAPTQESTNPGAGTVINQGDPIMEADDTGTSFHSHLHIYIVTGMPSVAQTNWWTNQTAVSNVQQAANPPERVQLGGFTTGNIEGTVNLPQNAIWNIEFTVSVNDSPGSDPNDSVNILIDGVLVVNVPNNPPGENILVQQQITGNSFTYRFEFTSSNATADLHQIINAGSATTDSSVVPGTNSIPFVFEDVDNDKGLMEFLTWYRAGD